MKTTTTGFKYLDGDSVDLYLDDKILSDRGKTLSLVSFHNSRFAFTDSEVSMLRKLMDSHGIFNRNHILYLPSTDLTIDGARIEREKLAKACVEIAKTLLELEDNDNG